ncbi:methylosome subunit pICln [Strongylocentrotus purpuratus]|uniref:Methylosome subunit pICln n=1 Tax=Strongylocentrotus purpuratus TaxID=7668 RepID=A0A7M7SXA0_STRPU|nr:methylosome subunit pICln [Strongylocentrotus purpuratus]
MMGFIAPIQPPQAPVRWQKEDTIAFVEKQDLSKGTLYIAESHVAWINPSGQGFNIPYRAITVHAISRDLSSFPHECLYLMIDSDVNNSDDGFEEEEGNEVREIRLVPQDKTMLQSMFEAMSQCQALHPDPDESDNSDPYDQGDEDEEVGEEEGGEEDPEIGIELIVADGGNGDAMDTGQFDDADMGPEH